jgi:acyl-CoA thioester hydrolase
MARIKIGLPGTFSFSTTIPIRITDLNYGNHVGNDAILSILHEARMQFLHQYGYTEMKMAGVAMIMSDVAIQFKTELFYGDTVIAYVAAGEFTKVGFEFYYKLEKQAEGKKFLVAIAKSGMVCYDYDKKRIVAVPEQAITKLNQEIGLENY